MLSLTSAMQHNTEECCLWHVWTETAFKNFGTRWLQCEQQAIVWTWSCRYESGLSCGSINLFVPLSQHISGENGLCHLDCQLSSSFFLSFIPYLINVELFLYWQFFSGISDHLMLRLNLLKQQMGVIDRIPV